MSDLGVEVAIMRDGQVLLTKREDFEVWCLPGGHPESGEPPAEAAVREAREETGLDVRLTRLVGMYSMRRWNQAYGTEAVYAAEIVGGDLLTHTAETLDAQFFSLDKLPNDVFWWHEQRIRDALSGLCGVVCTQEGAWPFPDGITRTDLYRMRDESGLGRLEFFRQHHPRGEDRVVIKGVSTYFEGEVSLVFYPNRITLIIDGQPAQVINRNPIELAVADYIGSQYQLLIGGPTAARIILEIGSVQPLEVERTYIVKGRSLTTGLPASVELSSIEIRQVILPHMDQISAVIANTVRMLSNTAFKGGRLMEYISTHGIILRGEYSQLRHLDTYLSQKTGLNVIRR
jgi:ADP-ribose pyrophosphatase YjhB (NUDIX family)